MSVRFSIPKTFKIGKILVRELDLDDWGPNDEEAVRFQDRGDINDPTGSYEDWGNLPKASAS